jgi:uncharacterized membrane protein
MFKRNRGRQAAITDAASSVKQAVADAADAVVEYADPLVKDEKLRRRLLAAFAASAAARRRVRRQSSALGLVTRLAADPVLRSQLAEVAAQLQFVQKRAKKARTHRARNTILFVSGIGMTVAAVPSARAKVMSLIRRRGDEDAKVIAESIDVNVPLTTAYNQWTQFEEFPRFMEGVDEVRQLDDTLLHWAATVGGKHAQWDAKILEQKPDTRITWESIDGKQTRGTVSFEQAGADRTRVHLQMSYRPDGIAERVGSAVGLDNRRIRGDLCRFRDLIEERQVESGAWRGRVEDGHEQSAGAGGTSTTE